MIRGVQIGKEVKIAFFSVGNVLHIKGPKGSLRNLLQLLNISRKAERYKSNTQTQQPSSIPTTNKVSN